MDRIALIAILATLTATPLVGQARSPLAPGDRIKVASSTHGGTYRLEEVTSRGLVVRDTGSATERFIPLASVDGIKVDRGRRPASYGATRGAGVGALIGGVLGIGAGLAGGCSGDCLIEIAPAARAAAGGLLLGAIGGIAGMALGALSPGHRWEPVRLPLASTPRGSEARGGRGERPGQPVGVGVDLTVGGGLGLGVVLRF